MDSPQSVVSPLKNSAAEKPEFSKQTKPNGNQAQSNHHNNKENKSFIGVLNVYIHSARDIHNICIYHKQDVYAKLSLTSDPESSVSSTIINGGGQNPVFNDQVQLNVTTVETSVKCEIWMMSRVRNYLEDQLLGFALVPLSEVLINNGKLEKEFTLSSTDLFHSPAGYVQLSLDYTGAKPAVVIADLVPPACNTEDSEISEASPIASELDKIEFPDPKIVNEDEIMVSEYFGIPCTSLESDAGANASESGACGATESAEPAQAPKADSPPSSESATTAATSGVSSPSDSSEVAVKEKGADAAVTGKDSESESSGGSSSENSMTKPIVSVNIEPEQKVVQQDIVDMYMKSMQQFTESLAKMKLPLDIDTGAAATATTPSPSTNSAENSSSDSRVQSAKNNRVFYGSRAFF